MKKGTRVTLNKSTIHTPGATGDYDGKEKAYHYTDGHMYWLYHIKLDAGGFILVERHEFD